MPAETANARQGAETAELREQINELKLLLSEESGRVASLNKRLLEITQEVLKSEYPWYIYYIKLAM